MTLKQDLENDVADIFSEQWSTRSGQVVPEPENLKLGNDAIEFQTATVLYADLSGSTALVDDEHWQFAAEIYKTFLHCAAKIIKSEGGVITSYDGDRIMAVFVGGSQTRPAVRAALKINYAVIYLVNPALKAQYPGTSYVVKQVVGIDTGTVQAARTGVRGDNDIVWVGHPANYAAKLTELKLSEKTWITQDAFERLDSSTKEGGDPKRSIWKRYKWNQNKDKIIYGSTWHLPFK